MVKDFTWDKITSIIIASLGACTNYFFGGWDMAFKTILDSQPQ